MLVAQGFYLIRIGLVEESSVAVWVGDVSLTLSALAHYVASNTHQCPTTRVWFGW